jgi:hypothetical protein
MLLRLYSRDYFLDRQYLSNPRQRASPNYGKIFRLLLVYTYGKPQRVLYLFVGGCRDADLECGSNSDLSPRWWNKYRAGISRRGI